MTKFKYLNKVSKQSLAIMLMAAFLYAPVMSLNQNIGAKAAVKQSKYDQTMFLSLQLKDNKVLLVKASKLNRQFDLEKTSNKTKILNNIETGSAVLENDEIRYNLLNSKNEVIFSGIVSASLYQYYDYLDKNNQLTGGKKKLDNINFSIKAPYSKDIKKIEFYLNQLTEASTQQISAGSLDLSGLSTKDQLANSQFYAVSASYSATKVVNHGSSNDKIDIVIVGDGYTSSEIATAYTNHVNQFISGFSASEPYSQYYDLFNIWRVDVISAQSGVDRPCQRIYRNTALDATYGSCDMTHYLTSNPTKVFDAASSVYQAGGEYDVVLTVVNDTLYGGTGGSYVTYPGGYTPLNTVIQIILHELGHTIGDLEDEYTYPEIAYGYFPSNCLGTTVKTNDTYIGVKDLDTSGLCYGLINQFPNITAYTKTQLQSHALYKWSYWIGQEGVYVPAEYQGGRYVDYGLYRPTDNCLMKSLFTPLCPVCREHIVERLFDAYEPNIIQSASPDPYAGPYDAYQQFAIQKPNVSSLAIQWLIDNQAVPDETDWTFDFTGVSVSLGPHTLKAKVTDTNPWIKNPFKSIDARTWQVIIEELVDTTAPTISGPYQGYYKAIDLTTINAGAEIWWNHADNPYGSGLNLSTVKFEYKSVSSQDFEQLSLTKLDSASGAALLPMASLQDGDYNIKISASDNDGNYAEKIVTATVKVTPSIAGPYVGDGAQAVSGQIFSKSTLVYWQAYDDLTSKYKIISQCWYYKDESPYTQYSLPVTVKYVNYFLALPSAIIPASDLASGQYRLKISLTDLQNKTSVYDSITFYVDNLAPQISEVKATINGQIIDLANGQIFSQSQDNLSWISKDPYAPTDPGQWYVQTFGVIKKAYMYKKEGQEWSNEIELLYSDNNLLASGKYGQWSWIYPKQVLSAQGAGNYLIKFIAYDRFDKRTETSQYQIIIQ